MNEMIVYSAVQCSGRMHIGNYIGAFKQWKQLELQQFTTTIFSIADLHSLTSR